MKKLLLLILLVILSSCAPYVPDNPHVIISNKYAGSGIVLPSSCIISDNSTHIIISIPKQEAEFSIKYKEKYTGSSR